MKPEEGPLHSLPLSSLDVQRWVLLVGHAREQRHRQPSLFDLFHLVFLTPPRLKRLLTCVALSTSTHLSYPTTSDTFNPLQQSRGGPGVHRQVVGDLTWEVPMELEPDFGLCPKDKRSRHLRTHQARPASQDGSPASAAEPAADAVAAVPDGATHTAAAAAAQPYSALLGAAAPKVKPASSLPSLDSVENRPTWGVLHSLGKDGYPPPASSSILGLLRQLLGAGATQHLDRVIAQLLVSRRSILAS
jgi:hypothetical protein